MASRIEGSPVQSTQFPVEAEEAAVSESKRAAGAQATAAAKADSEEPLDAIERSTAQAKEDPKSGASGHPAGPAVSAHSLQLTGGKSGHQALEEKKEQEPKERIKEGETSHYEREPDGNSLRDRNWVSHSRTLAHRESSATRERQGHSFKTVERHASSHPGEKGMTSHRNPGGPKTEASFKFWEAEKSGRVAAFHPVEGAHGSISLFELQGHMGLKLESGPDGMRAQASAGAAAYLVNVEAHGEHKGLINAKGAAYTNVGARADANGALELDLKKGLVAVKGGVDAFVGATAGANGELAAGGMHLGGEARVEAGLGFQANGTAEFDAGKIKLAGDLGVCVGFGADMKFNVEIDPREVAAEAVKADEYLGKKEQEVADAALEAAANGVSKAATGVISFLESASEVAHDVKRGAEKIRELAGR